MAEQAKVTAVTNEHGAEILVIRPDALGEFLAGLTAADEPPDFEPDDLDNEVVADVMRYGDPFEGLDEEV